MEPHQARIDVEEARSMGIDAFALNVFSMESWSTNTIEWLFGAAAELGGFTLFFSFDMNHFTHPSQFFPLLERYIGHGSYTKWAGKEIVSKFNFLALKITLNLGSFIQVLFLGLI